MGVIECLFISIISIGWGCFWFAIGDEIKSATLHNNIGSFLQLIGAIFIATPIILVILVISIEIAMAMFYAIKAMLSAIPLI